MLPPIQRQKRIYMRESLMCDLFQKLQAKLNRQINLFNQVSWGQEELGIYSSLLKEKQR